MNNLIVIVAAISTVLSVIAAAEVTSQSYTTAEDISSSKTLFISQFQFEGEQPRGTLYAEVGDKSLVVGKSQDGKSYQVSWTEEHKNAGAGTYVVRIYNEEGHSNLRKAKRDGESADSIKPVTTLEVNHQGVWKGPWLSSETVACVVALLVMGCAYNRKAKILA